MDETRMTPANQECAPPVRASVRLRQHTQRPTPHPDDTVSEHVESFPGSTRRERLEARMPNPPGTLSHVREWWWGAPLRFKVIVGLALIVTAAVAAITGVVTSPIDVY